MKFDLFISYSRRDFDEVSSILEKIKTAIPDLSYWFDIDGIESGDEFEDKIISAIDNSSYVLFALSENSIESQWTKDEVMYAKNTDKKVIPVLLKGAQMKGWFLFKFGRVDCIDSTNALQMEKLLHNLSDWTGKNSVTGHVTELGIVKNPEQLCPCGSGKFFKDCHGLSSVVTKSSPVASPITTKPVERAWKVGDYFDVDGKKGVVFWVDETGKHGKIVSLDQDELQWCTREEIHNLSVIVKDEHDGMKNLHLIKKINDWRNKYPAFAWCAARGDSWYLPAIEELKLLLLNEMVHEAVNRTLVVYNAIKLFSKDAYKKWYWSSTDRDEHTVWTVNMNKWTDSKGVGTELTNNFMKGICRYCVRAVSAF